MNDFKAVITREDSFNRAEQLKMAAAKLDIPLKTSFSSATWTMMLKPQKSPAANLS